MGERDLQTLATGGSFFEGPRWHDGTWWTSDFYRRRVSRWSADGEETVVVEVEGQPSGLGWLPDGSLVISSMKDRRVLRLRDGELTVLADLAEHCGGHLNDLVVDAAGTSSSATSASTSWAVVTRPGRRSSGSTPTGRSTSSPTASGSRTGR